MAGQVTLTVKGAEKRDAGRGVARLPESARRALGVLSGDTVVIEGDRPAVAKVWPASGDDGIVRIDAETRANAGVNVGETATVAPVSIAEAERVVVEIPVDADDELLDAIASDLRDRPLRPARRSGSNAPGSGRRSRRRPPRGRSGSRATRPSGFGNAPQTGRPRARQTPISMPARPRRSRPPRRHTRTSAASTRSSNRSGR